MPRLIPVPTRIEAAGKPPKTIKEFFGRVNSGTNTISIARMQSPAGWREPGQTPESDEYTVVLAGTLRVITRGQTMDVCAGQAARNTSPSACPPSVRSWFTGMGDTSLTGLLTVTARAVSSVNILVQLIMKYYD